MGGGFQNTDDARMMQQQMNMAGAASAQAPDKGKMFEAEKTEVEIIKQNFLGTSLSSAVCISHASFRFLSSG